jgi:hypothetical protein
MFEPNERQNLLNILRPPSGYRLESAVAATFSLDFVALTAVLLALVDVDQDADDGARTHVDSLHAITRLADRVHVFVNRGQIAGPREGSKVTILFDRIIHEVCLPQGSFHPKVWVTHYTPRNSAASAKLPGLVRVICTSRNLTTSHCWEAFVCCEGVEGKGKTSEAISAGLRGFLMRLGNSTPDASGSIIRLCQTLSRITFDYPQQLKDEANFLWQWYGGQNLHQHLPIQSNRALVVSPFVRRSFLEHIVNRTDQVTVVATQRELDAIQDDAFINRLVTGKNRAFVVSPCDTDDGGTSMELHAKLLIFENTKKSKTFIGSANASSNGWRGRNCETMVSFAPGISIDHFCNRFIFGDEPAKPGGRRPLRGWIREYQRQPWVEDEQEMVERFVDEICGQLARLQLVLSYDAEQRELKLVPEIISPEVIEKLNEWELSCDLQVGLLSKLQFGGALKPLKGIANDGIRFDNVALNDLTEFLIVEVIHRRVEYQRRFILKAKVNFLGWREQRDVLLLQELLTRDSLQLFLKAILFDAIARPSTAEPPTGGGQHGGKSTTSVWSELSVEDIIRSCTEDISRIDEINRVLKAFENSDWIEDDFRQFWETFLAAEAEARDG